MLWAGWECIMFPSWLQVSSKAFSKRLLFAGACNTAQRRGTQDFWGNRISLFTEVEDTILGGQWEDSRVARWGEKLGTGLVVGTRLFSKCKWQLSVAEVCLGETMD